MGSSFAEALFSH